MDSDERAAQAKLLIDLGEPESWLETLQREARRAALHAGAQGDETLAERWRRLDKALDSASAVMSSESAPKAPDTAPASETA